MVSLALQPSQPQRVARLTAESKLLWQFATIQEVFSCAQMNRMPRTQRSSQKNWNFVRVLYFFMQLYYLRRFCETFQLPFRELAKKSKFIWRNSCDFLMSPKRPAKTAEMIVQSSRLLMDASCIFTFSQASNFFSSKPWNPSWRACSETFDETQIT